MNLISQIFFMELITTVTGSIVLLIWWVMNAPFLKVNAKIALFGINWALVMSVIPFGYAMIRLNLVSSYIMENDTINLNFQMTELTTYGFWAITAGWLLLGAYRLVWYGRQIAGDIGLSRGNVPEDKEQVLELFEELKERFGVSERVAVVQNDYVSIPRTMGVLHPCVVLPYTEEDYDRRKLEIILSHELMHIRYHDVWYKILTACIVAIQCFNPLIFLLSKNIELFCENRCDAHVRDAMQAHFSNKEYFAVIDGMAEDMEKRENTSFLGSSLVHRSSLERRLIFMKSYSRKTRVSKLATMVLSMAFVLCSAVSSYAASVEVSEIHDSIYKATDPVVRVYDEDGNEVEAHYFTAEDWAETNVEYEDGLELNPRVKSAGSFVWAIKANTRCCTPIISLSSGTRISVAATVRPSDSTFWMGVVLDSNGTGWYVDATEAAKYTFEVTSAGKYRVFVENRTSSKMNASGSYNF